MLGGRGISRPVPYPQIFLRICKAAKVLFFLREFLAREVLHGVEISGSRGSEESKVRDSEILYLFVWLTGNSQFFIFESENSWFVIYKIV